MPWVKRVARRLHIGLRMQESATTPTTPHSLPQQYGQSSPPSTPDITVLPIPPSPAPPPTLPRPTIPLPPISPLMGASSSLFPPGFVPLAFYHTGSLRTTMPDTNSIAPTLPPSPIPLQYPYVPQGINGTRHPFQPQFQPSNLTTSFQPPGSSYVPTPTQTITIPPLPVNTAYLGNARNGLLPGLPHGWTHHYFSPLIVSTPVPNNVQRWS